MWSECVSSQRWNKASSPRCQKYWAHYGPAGATSAQSSSIWCTLLPKITFSLQTLTRINWSELWAAMPISSPGRRPITICWRWGLDFDEFSRTAHPSSPPSRLTMQMRKIYPPQFSWWDIFGNKNYLFKQFYYFLVISCPQHWRGTEHASLPGSQPQVFSTLNSKPHFSQKKTSPGFISWQIAMEKPPFSISFTAVNQRSVWKYRISLPWN